MTYEKSIWYLKDFLKDNRYCMDDQSVEAFEFAIKKLSEETKCTYNETGCGSCKVLEKANKYAWHDLRKNPDDLPEPIDIPHDYFTTDFKLVETAFGRYVAVYRTFGTGARRDKPHWWYRKPNGSMKMMGERVIAWKEIEPFEEVAE